MHIPFARGETSAGLSGWLLDHDTSSGCCYQHLLRSSNAAQGPRMSRKGNTETFVGL